MIPASQRVRSPRREAVDFINGTWNPASQDAVFANLRNWDTGDRSVIAELLSIIASAGSPAVHIITARDSATSGATPFVRVEMQRDVLQLLQKQVAQEPEQAANIR